MRLAYAVHGRGPPLVRVATWLSHLELDWQSPVWRHWCAARRTAHGRPLRRARLRALGRQHRRSVARDVGRRSRSGRRCGEPRAIRVARHLPGGRGRRGVRGTTSGPCLRPRPLRRVCARATVPRRGAKRTPLAAIRAGWKAPDPAFRKVFSTLFLPGGTPEQMAWYEDLLRHTTSPDAATGCSVRVAASNVSGLAPRSVRGPWSCTRGTIEWCRPKRAGCSPR